MKKLLALVLALVMSLSLVACGSSDSNTDDSKDTFTVGVVQLVQHEALDAATQGFVDALKDALGDKVTVKIENASNDIPACTSIVNGFTGQNVDLIMANATSALQAAAAATSTIPILGTSVTDYATALEIADWTGTVGRNISGTSDLAPLDKQADMLLELCPSAKNVGMLYCSSEPNSKYQVDEVTKLLTAKGLTCTEFSFTDSNDVASVAQNACANSDVIFIPTDNTAAANTESIANVVLPAGVPVIAGESGLCKGCGIATLSIDYYELGKITGQMAVKILTGESDITTMPVEFAPSAAKLANMDNCAKLNITVPADYAALS